MVTRLGFITLHVRHLDAAVAFQRDVLGMVETERVGTTAYLTCNDRHHELVLVGGAKTRGYAHIALEVDDAAALERARQAVPGAGGRIVGAIHEGGPGIDRALLVEGPGGHVFKLFSGMAATTAPEPGDRPSKFEHVSLKVRDMGSMERFLQKGLGFRFSDRMGPLASWWHCDADHHGIALVRAPRPELSHYAYAWPDFASLGRVADRLRAHRDRGCIWGPSRHGPGNNHFLYLHDEDGAMVECCAELAQMDDYQPRAWPIGPQTINRWGGPPPLRFVLTGYRALPAGAHA